MTASTHARRVHGPSLPSLPRARTVQDCHTLAEGPVSPGTKGPRLTRSATGALRRAGTPNALRLDAGLPRGTVSLRATALDAFAWAVSTPHAEPTRSAVVVRAAARGSLVTDRGRPRRRHRDASGRYPGDFRDPREGSAGLLEARADLVPRGDDHQLARSGSARDPGERLHGSPGRNACDEKPRTTAQPDEIPGVARGHLAREHEDGVSASQAKDGRPRGRCARPGPELDPALERDATLRSRLRLHRLDPE